MSTFQRVAIGAATVAILSFAAMGAGFCAFTLHVPRRFSLQPPQAAAVRVTASDGVHLDAWWFVPRGFEGRCVAVLHGIADSKGSSAGFAPMFLAERYAVLAPDSRAHGASGGELVTYGLLERQDVLAWAKWMRGQGCQRIYGLGESLGGAILIQAAALQPAFDAIVAEGAFADLEEAGQDRMRRMLPFPAFLAAPLAKLAVFSGIVYARAVYGLDFREVSPLKSIARSATPILLIHGLADTRTPPANSRRLAEANPRNSLWLLPGVEHTSAASQAPREFHERVLGWFASHEAAR